MTTDFSTAEHTRIATSIAPEDLKCGDFVAILNEVIEFPSYLWTNMVTTQCDALLRVRCIPSGAGMPLKVKAICLPFVFVRPTIGECETIDVRRVQLVRLDEHYGKTVWKSLRQKKPQSDGQNLER